MGVGAMTDFGPLIANPKSLLLGAAAQLGIFLALHPRPACWVSRSAEASSIGIIGGADGPTAIYVTTKLAPAPARRRSPSPRIRYMALVPVIQPPIMKALTTKKERQIVMEQLRTGQQDARRSSSRSWLPSLVSLMLPSAAPLIGIADAGQPRSRSPA